MGELEGKMRSRLTQIVESESRAMKVVEDLKMAQAEAVSRDSRISELETHLSEAEDRLLKAEEGHAVVESNLSKSKDTKNTAFDSLSREDIRCVLGAFERF